ncbi:RlpA-like double-psi beta-barrel-containing domain containing protein [Elaphomyces granulatus]
MLFGKALVALATVFGLPAAVAHNGGRGTTYYQNNAAGSCGKVNPDSALIVALGNYWMKNQDESPYCGCKIKVKNVGSNSGSHGKGNTLTVTVADTCESCGENDIDFSLGAWNKLTKKSYPGTIIIDWEFE